MIREYWILGDRCHPDGYIVPDKYKRDGVRVIEKSAADKLAEALECAIGYREQLEIQNNMCNVESIRLREVLQEYRGEE